MPKDNIDYSNTIIYKIYCKDKSITDVYVGHTTNFPQRKYQHKICSKKDNVKLYNIIRENGGWENWEMVEVAKYNCKDSSEARIKEQQHFEMLNSSLNTNPPILNKSYLYCKECNKQFSTKKEFNLHNHKTSSDILKELNLKYNNIKNLNVKYECKICNYFTIRKNNFERHNLSEKHNKMCNILENNNKEKNEQNEQNEQNELNLKALTNIVLEVVKQSKELASLNYETQKHNKELTDKIFEIYNSNNSSINNVTNNTQINNNNNNNNKTFNLNVFLNETCKDAMNINDFVDSLQLQLSDLEDVGKLGFVEGISNIIVKNLKAMDIHKRPVHCADQKREVLYIKDEDKWEKENEQKQRLRKAIKRVAFKNEKLLPKYKEEHPGCNYSDSKFSDQYSKLVIEAMGGSGNNLLEKEDKIIKKIAREVIIDKSNS